MKESTGWSGLLIVRSGDRTAEGIYSDSDELKEDELEEEVEEVISTSIGRATLSLGAELVILDRSEEEDIKGRIGNLLVENEGSDARRCLKARCAN